MRGALQLRDSFHVESSAGGTVITLGKLRPRRLPLLERKDITHITNALMQRVSEDLLAEMHRQNQDLLRTLEELRVQQEEVRGHLLEIETLNVRLQRSVQATHHRVKNNMQIIAALVDIQVEAGDTEVPVAVIMRIGHHARALAALVSVRVERVQSRHHARALAALHDILTEKTKTDAQTEVISAKSTMENWKFATMAPDFLPISIGGRPPIQGSV
jgi:two-component sensor histidine kinase